MADILRNGMVGSKAEPWKAPHFFTNARKDLGKQTRADVKTLLSEIALSELG